MLKKLLVVVITVSLLTLVSPASTAAQTSESEFQRTAAATLSKEDIERAHKAKKALSKLGYGPGARLVIRLHDKSELKGVVGETGDDYFTFKDEHGVDLRVPYAQVDKVNSWPTTNTAAKSRGSSGLGTLMKVGIGVAILSGGLVAVCAISHRCQE
jgi:hypothetical protein